MTAPPDIKIIGPQLTTRQGALFGVVDIELVLFSLIILLVMAFIAKQVTISDISTGIIVGSSIGLLVNIIAGIPSRLVITTVDLNRSRITKVLSSLGYAEYQSSDCFAPQRFRALQLPGQRIALSQKEGHIELVGPTLMMRIVKRRLCSCLR
jgi:hypothetical protein